MLNFNKIDVNQFLTNYWQKKSLLIRSALPHFQNPLTANELAGLAMEEEIESRLVIQTPDKLPKWTLKRGPFSKRDFKQLPKSHWTLLIQGVDRFIPEVTSLLDHFNFLPQWRFDDVMISYAPDQGSVGPHYDNYDVFLYQAQGRRKWLLTTSDCVESNYQEETELRIMKIFNTETEFVLEEGDMLYLPPHVGHHGISLSNDCITYSFGYRSYQGQELFDSFTEYLAAKRVTLPLYQDPLWSSITETSELPPQAWKRAKETMLAILEDEVLLRDWFGTFTTTLDPQAESLLPLKSSDDNEEDAIPFKKNLKSSLGLTRNPLCRFAYIKLDNPPFLSLYLNGCSWNIDEVSINLVEKIADHRTLFLAELLPFIENNANCSFLYELWKLQWLEFLDEKK